MYKAFNLEIPESDFGPLYNFEYEAWRTEQKQSTQESLEKYITTQKNINVSTMEEDWFPQVKADIFLSHSHKDHQKAERLANYLWDNFKLKAFIDADLWGFADDLLRKIDDKYCYSSESDTYSYASRNITTSHVHMILAIALQKMIDQTECTFLINTPNSITNPVHDANSTYSAWIYLEIETAKRINPRLPKRLITEAVSVEAMDKMDTEYSSKSIPDFQYNTDLSFMTPLVKSDLEYWKQIYTPSQHPLDQLYNIKF